MLKANEKFLIFFYDNTIKIVLILAPGREFFHDKCVKFSLTFTE